MIYGISDQGFRMKRLADIKAELEIAWKSVFGSEADVSAASVAGQIIGVYSEREALVWELAKDTYDSQYPSSANGVSLDKICDITAIERLDPTYSEVVCKCSGDEGTVIAAGKIVSVINTGARFVSQAEATIPASGEIDVLFQAQNIGAVQAPAGSLTVIETPVTGWTSCINEQDADVGRESETDPELRLRRQESLQIVGAATPDSIRARLLDDVENVTDVFVYENDTDDIDSEARAPHSVQIIVAGGLSQEIADKIWEVKAGGIPTVGIGGAPTIAITGYGADGSDTFVTAVNHNAVAGDYVKIWGATEPEYNGSWKILRIKNPNQFVIGTTYIGHSPPYGFARVSHASESVVVQDSQGYDHTINFDRAASRLIWMHVQVSVGAEFDIGVYQKDRLTVEDNNSGDNLTITVNGRDYDVVAGVDAETTAAAIATAINDIGTNGWIPVTATHSSPNEYLDLTSNYRGNAYIVSWTSDGDTSIDVSAITLNSGDQSEVTQNIIEFAEGSEELTKEQIIGADVYLSRYYTPINEVGSIQSVEIYLSNGLEGASFWPTTAPPGGGDWDQNNITVEANEIAEFDTLRVTVEIV